jgi:hypothetical protein
LVDILPRRVRGTDDLGWLDECQLGVILPDTSDEGARRVADDICRGLASEMARPACEVFVFAAREQATTREADEQDSSVLEVDVLANGQPSGAGCC